MCHSMSSSRAAITVGTSPRANASYMARTRSALSFDISSPREGGNKVIGVYAGRASMDHRLPSPSAGAPGRKVLGMAAWDDVQRIALALPETSERASHGHRHWWV